MRGNEEGKELSAPAEQLVRLACQELGEMSARRRAEGFLKLNARPARSMRGQRLPLILAVALAAIALALGGRRWVGSRQVEAALSYAVQGGRIDASGSLEASGAAQPALQFSDGTRLVFLGGARGQLKSVGPHGARISLTGKVDVAVAHARGSQWVFDAGPFLITVTGTAFTAEWREVDGRLEVALRTGAIAVTGPLADRAITLRGGQRLIISTREKEVLIRDLDSSTEASAPSLPRRSRVGTGEEPRTPRSEASLSERSRAAAPVPDPPAQVAPNWTTELAAGRFAIILQQAEQRGLESVLAGASSDDLAALSDAARYSRRDELARRALVAQRRRFPQSRRANDAAFLLGRLEETAQHPELALAWYERCLAESPHGTYLSEALGRKMTVVQRLHGAARARPIAEEYLRRFGNGTYAAAARALIRAPR